MTWMGDNSRPVNICYRCPSCFLAGVCAEKLGYPVTDSAAFHHKVAGRINSKCGTKRAISERLWESLLKGGGETQEKLLSDEAKTWIAESKHAPLDWDGVGEKREEHKEEREEEPLLQAHNS